MADRIHHEPLAAVALGLALASAALVLAFASPAGAEPLKTVDEVLACHLEARGGEAWRALRGLELEGTYTAFSEPAPFTLHRQRPDLYRFETTMLEQPMIDGYDGERSWMLFPLFGLDWPIPAPAPEATRIDGLADFDGPLIDAAEKGHRVELAGVEDFEGEAAYRLEVELAGGGEETWFLAVDDCLERGRDAATADFGRPVSGRSFFSDFRRVGGVTLAHRIDEEYGIRYRSVEVESVALDPDLDPELFAYRPAPEMEPLAPLAGEWTVTVETRPAERAPWSVVSTFPSAIESEFHGALLEQRIDLRGPIFQRDQQRSLSYDRFRELYVLSVFEQLTAHRTRLVGKLEDGKLTLDDLATETVPTMGGTPEHTRIAIHSITPEGFVLDTSFSTDGETWQHLVRETYRRGEG